MPIRYTQGLVPGLRETLLCLLVLGAATACGGSDRPATATPTPGASASPRPAPSAPRQLLGFQVHMWGLGTTPAKLDELRALGADVLRVDFGWANLEGAGKGVYDEDYLARFDELVQGAAARGIKVVVTVWQTPCWASSMAGKDCAAPASSAAGAGAARHYLPANPADMADVIRMLQRRWGDAVAGYELWNEPNQATFLRVDPGRDPAREYARLVAGVHDAVKATDPATVIVAGSLANSDVAWTNRVLDAGASGHFDAWSIHPYALDRSPLAHEPRTPRASPIDGIPRVHGALLAHGDDVPMWLTEFGHSTCTARNQPHEFLNCVSEADQAAFMTQYLHLIRSLPYVAVATYYELLDGTFDTIQDRYGVVRSDGSRKPAYAAFAAAGG